MKIVLSADMTDDVFQFYDCVCGYIQWISFYIFLFVILPIVIIGWAAVKSIFGKQQVLKICLARKIDLDPLLVKACWNCMLIGLQTYDTYSLPFCFRTWISC